MPTSKADRLNRLFEGDSLPPLPDASTSHIADTEIISKRQPVQQPWKVPKVAQTPRKITRSPPRTGRDLDQLTSSDDDEYVRAFRKPPAIKPETTAKARKKTNSSSGYHFNEQPRAKTRAKSSSDAITKSDPNDEKDDGVSKADRHGHPLVGRFCPLTLVTKFCYKYMDDPNDRVSRHFFASGKIWNRTWDIYYIHPPASLFAKPLLLVPEVQVQALLDEINSTFRISIKLPRDPFLLAFYQDGTPAPTLLGTSQSRDAAGKMEQEIPPPAENHGECPPAASPETERSFERFKEKMERAAVAAKKKNAAIKKAKTKDRLAAHVRSCEALRRGQRYLGLRPVDHKGGLPLPDPSLSWDEQQKFEREQKIKHGHILEPLDIEKPAPHPFDRDVVFVSIDVEAFERNHNLITEVGISTLDTADIESLAPSQGGANWMEHIRSRHFRITDHEHLRNTTFCTGNPDKFQFGRSEFVSMKEVGQLVDSCFAPPYSTDFVHDGKSKPQDSTSVKSMQLPDQLQSVSLEAGESAQERVPGQQTSSNAVDGQGLANAEQKLANKATASSILTSPEDRETSEYDLDTTSIRTGPTKDTIISPTPTSPRPKTKYRNIVLVGHDLDSDLQYLSTLQSSIFHKPPIPTYPQPLECESHLRQHILESLDTALLYQVWKRETNITSLAKALVGVERTGWELHNGGNDARYTMETLVGVLVRSRVEEGEVSKAASSDSKSSNVKSGKHPEEVQAKEEKLARTIRERQEAVEKEERENAALWRHAIGPYGEDVDEQVLPDPYQSTQLEGTQDPNLAMHSAADPCTPGHVSASASASAHTIHSSHEAGEAYPWSSCPRASRDGGEPRGFEMPVPKGEKGKPSTRRREEVLRLQDEGEIGPPCDWGVGGRDGW